MSAGDSNGGTAIISPAEIIDRQAYTGGDYTVTLTSPSTFDIVDNTSGTTVMTNASYTAGMNVEVGGIQFSLGGEPVSGDKF